MLSRASPAVGLGAPGLARRGLGQARQATDHPIRAGQAQGVAQAEQRGDPKHLVPGDLGWQRA